MRKSNIFKFKPLLPSGVRLYKKNNHLFFKKNSVMLYIKNFYKPANVSQLPSYCKLVYNNLIGISAGYSISLNFMGIGYRVHKISDSILKLKLGFSHIVSVPIPLGIKLYSPQKNLLVIVSEDLINLRSFAYFLKALKMPDCYKAKGVLIKNENIFLKEGKKQ